MGDEKYEGRLLRKFARHAMGCGEGTHMDQEQG